MTTQTDRTHATGEAIIEALMDIYRLVPDDHWPVLRPGLKRLMDAVRDDALAWDERRTER